MPAESAADFAAEAQRQMDEYQAVLADYPHLVEVVGGYVAKSRLRLRDRVRVRLDLILDSLDKLRDA